MVLLLRISMIESYDGITTTPDDQQNQPVSKKRCSQQKEQKQIFSPRPYNPAHIIIPNIAGTPNAQV